MSSRMGALVLLVLAAIVVPPFYADAALLQAGLFVCATGIGAIGLNLLTGVTGQLSLATAFFVAIGAYGYVVLTTGAGLPGVFAAVLAPVAAGLAGLVFSPVSTRIRGLYLGVASLALVFLGQHVLVNATTVTGGYEGMVVPPLQIGGLALDDDSGVVVLDVPFGRYELLWPIAVLFVAIGWWFARGVVGSRPGRGMQAVRDGEVFAAVLGVDVRARKVTAFVMSSVYAGVAGVLYALAVGHVVPDSFALTMSTDYLAMVVLGGLGTVGGSLIGAAIVTGLPLLLGRYSDGVSFLADPGSGGLDAASLARYVYGAVVVALMIFEPAGLPALYDRAARRVRRHVFPRDPAARDPVARRDSGIRDTRHRS